MAGANSTQTVADEAARLFRDVIERLSMGQADLAFALRTLLHATNLLGWSDAADWLSKEIKGHDGKSPVPAHRWVQAYREWRPYALDDVVEQVVVSRRSPTEREAVTWILTAGIDDLVRYAQKGVIVRQEDDEERWFDVSRKVAKGRVVTVVEAGVAKGSLDRLQNELFEWASRSYVATKTGDLAKDLWLENRSAVDQFLATVGMSGHLQTIQDGLQSNEPQQWREAMWSSRDLLHDLAAYLWRDSRNTYAPLKDDDGHPIEVTENKYINRLMAYLHQKGVTGTSGAYLRSEWARLRHLNALASSAHDKDAVSSEDARLVFASVYLLVSELVRRTDLNPIVEYE